MKKSDFKKIIKECLKEIIFEEKFLSNIVEEAVRGTTNALLSESQQSLSHSPGIPQQFNVSQNSNQQHRQRLMSEIKSEMRQNGVSAYGNAPKDEWWSDKPKSNSSNNHVDIMSQNGNNLHDPGIPENIIQAIMNKQI